MPLDSTFLFSGWAKGAADPDSVAAKTEESDPYFGLVLRFYYSDNSSEVHYYPFDTYYTDWQYIQGIAVPEKTGENITITSVTIVAAYDNNINAAYIDNLSFRMEPVQTYKYDEDGNLESTAQTGAGSDASEYDEEGIDLLKHTAANGTSFNYTYNAAHDVTSAVSDGVTANYSYDPLGNVTGTTLTDGTLTMYSSSSVTPDGNHTASVTNTAGKTTHYTYDSTYDYLTEVVNAKSQSTLYEYDNNTGRNTRVIGKDADGAELASIQYTYTDGQLTALTRTTKRGSATQSQTYSFAYNLWGQSTSVKVGNQPLASYTYEDIGGNPTGTGGGLMTQMTYGNGDSVSYTYDEFDRLVEMRYNDTGNYVTYLYNAENALAELSYREANNNLIASYAFEYDSLGRLIRSAEYNASGLVQRTEHLYDGIGRLASQTWVVSGDSFSESYVYNDPETAEDSGDGSLSQMTTATGATIDFHYDDLKRLEGRTVKNGETTLYDESYTYYNHNLNGINGAGTWVAFHRVEKGNGSALITAMYNYDALGNITSVNVAQDPYNPVTKYYYDDQNQLIREDYYDGLGSDESHITDSYTYTYDTAGNLLTESKNGTVTKTYSYGNSQWNDLLTEYKSNVIAYEGQELEETTDRWGFVTYTVTGSPSSGNPISYYNGRRWEMEWQHGRSLARASNYTTNVLPVSENKIDTEVTQTYAYDADGIRTAKTHVEEIYHYVDSSSGIASVNGNAESQAAISYVRYLYSTSTVTHNYITQNGKVVRETITSGDNVKVLDFIYDESGKPFALKYTNGTASPVTYYYILNLQGDVLGLINASGTLVARYTYNAWGELTYSSGSMAEINPLRYRGYYYDTETGFYYLQSRYYDPVTHRFINADTAEYSAMAAYSLNDTNLFSYCGNNPVSRADDGGEFWHIVVGAVVGAVVGIVSQVVTSKLAGETVTLEEIVIAGSFGAIEGALIATCPVAAPGISAAVSATESVVQDVTENRIENGDNTVVDIFSNATVSAGFGALTNSIGINGNSALYNKAGAAIKDAYISTVRPTVQKLARNAVGAGAKEFGKSLAGDTGAGVVFGLIEKGYQEIVKYFVK